MALERKPTRHRARRKYGGTPHMVSGCSAFEAIAKASGCIRHHLHLSLICVALVATRVALAGELDKVVYFHIETQTLTKAILDFGVQAHIQVMLAANSAEHVSRPERLNGPYVARVALAELLKGTSLRFIAYGDTVEIVPTDASAIESRKLVPKGAALVGTGIGSSDDPPGPPASKAKNGPIEKRRPVIELGPVVVTGTLIPGVKNLASPLTVFTRSDIDNSGATTLQQFMQQQSFDWGGGASENPIGSLNGGGTADDRTEGSGINLRGIGNDATLVLINGHRIAPGNTDANFVDTSLIPLNAIERIEVEPAGASAIYGADAVGGVVNIILRRDFQGAQTSLRYGSVTRGGAREKQAGQLAGTTWSSGSMVFGYQYDDRTPLSASDRSFSMENAEPFDLLPEQVQQSAFASLQQQLSSVTDVYGTAIFAHRGDDLVETFGSISAPLFTSAEGPVHTTLGEGILGTDIQLSASDSVDVSAMYSGTSSVYRSTFDGSPSLNLGVSYSVASLNGKLTGSLFDLSGGPVRFAVGAELRREALDSADLIAKSSFDPSRGIESGYLELNVPLLGPPQGAQSESLLAGSIAGRVDHYSDFGTTVNPNVGITWRPLSVLKFRSTFGTSFAAPDLSKLDPVPSSVGAESVPDPLTGGMSNVLEVYGGNADLKPETADTFTTGIDFGQEGGQGLQGSLTYYHIDFQRLILSIEEAGLQPNDALELESELGPSIVERNPPLSEVMSLASNPGFADETGIPGGVNLDSIAAIINTTEQNLSRLRTAGLDFKLLYSSALNEGVITIGLNGTYITKFERQVAAETPVFSVLNTPYNPISFRGRSEVAYTYGGLVCSTFVNYVAGYSNPNVSPAVPVSSWTTLDFNLRYTVAGHWWVFKDATVSLSVLNAANRNPPFVASPLGAFLPAASFDGANANTLGRFISLELSQRY